LKSTRCCIKDRGRPSEIDLARLKKLVLLVIIVCVCVWCYKGGIYLQKLRPIKVKKYRRKAKSIFRYDLDYISNCLLNALKPMEIDITKLDKIACTAEKVKEG